MADIGDGVIDKACDFASQFRLSMPFGGHIPFTINDFQRQFTQNRLVQKIRAARLGNDLTGETIKLELTETVMMQNMANTQSQCSELREMGVEIILDDIGSGYSSLSMLDALPFSAVKLDGRFISRLTTAPGECSLAGKVGRFS